MVCTNEEWGTNEVVVELSQKYPYGKELSPGDTVIAFSGLEDPTTIFNNSLDAILHLT